MPMCHRYYRDGGRAEIRSPEAKTPYLSFPSSSPDVPAVINSSSISNSLHTLSLNATTWLRNNSLANLTEGPNNNDPNSGSWLHFNDIQLIKLGILIAVIVVLLLSACRLVMKTFSKFAESGLKDDGDFA